MPIHLRKKKLGIKNNFVSKIIMKKIYLGADHRGFKLKENIKNYLDSIKIPYEDLGAFELDPTDDYPDYAVKVAQKVAEERSRGILICGSAIGVCIVANKFKGVYAAPVSTEQEAMVSMTHNNANVLCLAGWNLSLAKAKKIVRIWLRTEHKIVVRHERRLAKVKAIENENFRD